MSYVVGEAMDIFQPLAYKPSHIQSIKRNDSISLDYAAGLDFWRIKRGGLALYTPRTSAARIIASFFSE